MILPSMYLADGAADSRSVIADDHEEVLCNESHFLVCLYDFYMRESLPVRAHLILALDDQNSTFPQDAMCFLACIHI